MKVYICHRIAVSAVFMLYWQTKMIFTLANMAETCNLRQYNETEL